MISLTNLHTHHDYATTLSMFNNSPKTSGVWSIFKVVHSAVSFNKCPICECLLDNSWSRNSKNGITVLIGTIDHYRPKDPTLYPLLKYDHENYLLMCSDCNNVYKGNEFPLYPVNAVRDSTSISTTNITTELPLIVNPIYDNLFDLFKVVFRMTSSGRKVLELKAFSTDPYLKAKAKETIRLFSLGRCDEGSHSNKNTDVHTCRVDLLYHHFTKFNHIISIMQGRSLMELNVDEKHTVYQISKNLKLMEYGFFKFVMMGQYEYLIPT